MKIETLEELFVEELRDIYDAEKQLTKALPKMAKAATNEELREAFLSHLEETKTQVTRIEQIFELLGEKAKSKPCKAMKGLVEEGKEQIGEDMHESLHDNALIGAAQKVEHYEISSYGTVREFAKILGHTEVVALLQQTIVEEGNADKKLTGIARNIMKQVIAEQRVHEEDGEEKTARAASGNGRSRGSGSRSRGKR